MPPTDNPAGRPHISLILPAYNEAAAIGRTISEAVAYFEQRGLRYEIIVAADGTDGTREAALGMARERPAIKVIGEDRRRGKGRGVREAVRLSTGEIIGFADADNKVPIEEFDKLHRWLMEGYDLAIGSRAMQGAVIERRQPLYRRLGARVFGALLRLVINLPDISDTQCGFKFFHRGPAMHIFERQKVDGYMFDIEILALAQQGGYRIRQVPIRWRDDGDSRLAMLASNSRSMVDLIRIRLSLLAAPRKSKRTGRTADADRA